MTALSVYLMHHSFELFVKMVKLDVYNIFYATKKSDVFPSNVYDLQIGKHDVVRMLDDDDCKKWYDCIRDGSKLGKHYRINIDT